MNMNLFDDENIADIVEPDFSPIPFEGDFASLWRSEETRRVPFRELAKRSGVSLPVRKRLFADTYLSSQKGTENEDETLIDEEGEDDDGDDAESLLLDETNVDRYGNEEEEEPIYEFDADETVIDELADDKDGYDPDETVSDDVITFSICMPDTRDEDDDDDEEEEEEDEDESEQELEDKYEAENDCDIVHRVRLSDVERFIDRMLDADAGVAFAAEIDVLYQYPFRNTGPSDKEKKLSGWIFTENAPYGQDFFTRADITRTVADRYARIYRETSRNRRSGFGGNPWIASNRHHYYYYDIDPQIKFNRLFLRALEYDPEENIFTARVDAV
jgi:hypothetical protein